VLFSYAVFGLGDSAYWGEGTEDSAKYFCKPARDLDAFLQTRGGNRLAPAALGDDQHEDGYEGAWRPFERTVFEALGVKAVAGEELIGTKTLHDDSLKGESNFLRGTILQSLADKSTKSILPEDAKLTKFFGIYLQVGFQVTVPDGALCPSASPAGSCAPLPRMTATCAKSWLPRVRRRPTPF
jgi:sulfite reductase (NADPH) hemoprotein beta-component